MSKRIFCLVNTVATVSLLSTAFCRPEAIASQSAVIQTYLNQSLALTSLPANVAGPQRQAACANVRSARASLVQEYNRNPAMSYLQDVASDAQDLLDTLCQGSAFSALDQKNPENLLQDRIFQSRSDFVNRFGLLDIKSLRGDTLVNLSEWNSQPFCDLGGMDSFLCSYNHDGGRGIYIGRTKGDRNANYLVCLMRANASTSLISSNYAIESTCVVSALNWRAYLGADRPRTDVGGVLEWPNAAIFKTAIRMPAVLQKQCETGFKEANLCTPTIISMPTEHAHVVNLCRLNTNRSSIGIAGLIAITSATSQWGCQLLNLNVVEDKSRLTVNEDNCLPDFFANVDSSCNFPTIPRTEEPIRQRAEDAR